MCSHDLSLSFSYIFNFGFSVFPSSNVEGIFNFEMAESFNFVLRSIICWIRRRCRGKSLWFITSWKFLFSRKFHYFKFESSWSHSCQLIFLRMLSERNARRFLNKPSHTGISDNSNISTRLSLTSSANWKPTRVPGNSQFYYKRIIISRCCYKQFFKMGISRNHSAIVFA